MMAGLFLAYLLAALLVFWQKRNLAFGLVIINLILCLAMLLLHSTDMLGIRL